MVALVYVIGDLNYMSTFEDRPNSKIRPDWIKQLTKSCVLHIFYKSLALRNHIRVERKYKCSLKNMKMGQNCIHLFVVALTMMAL